VYWVRLLFHFLRSATVAIWNFVVVLQISTFIHILNRKYHISTYHMMSIISFSFTIWRFQPIFFLVWIFFENFIQVYCHFLSTFFVWCNLAPKSQKKALMSSPLHSDLCEDQPMGASRCTRGLRTVYNSKSSELYTLYRCCTGALCCDFLKFFLVWSESGVGNLGTFATKNFRVG